jgi:hypothetical protein
VRQPDFDADSASSSRQPDRRHRELKNAADVGGMLANTDIIASLGGSWCSAATSS